MNITEYCRQTKRYINFMGVYFFVVVELNNSIGARFYLIHSRANALEYMLSLGLK